MASTSLVFEILARDKASREFENVGNAADDAGRKGSKFGATMAAGVAVAATAAVAFAKSSVDAYVEAEQSSVRLDEALKKFPATNDVTRASFDKLNESLAKKTRFDDDATASGQAVLAQFGLTGTEIQKLTPLLQDYAAKTGKDLPAAAQDLGKALLGQGRSLKEVGIDFKDTGTKAGNLDAITAGLRTQVGGFAEVEGKTAAGTAVILKNRFGEVEEKVGGKLVPVLTTLADKLLVAIDYSERHSRVLLPLTAAVVGLTAAVVAVNLVTTASTAITAAATAVRAFFTTTTIAATGVEKASTISVIAGTVARTAHTVATGIATAATVAFTAAQTALNFVLRANPIGLVITAIALLATGVVLAYQKSDTFRGIVDGLWKAITTAKDRLGEFLSKMLSFSLPGWVKDLAGLFGGIASGIGNAFSKLKGGFGDGPGIGGRPGGGGQPRGVQQMMASLPPGTRLISGFRPGAITATGNPSYHGQGRAVDLPASLALFNYIKARFGSVAKELIFSPAGGRQVHNGREHYYSGVTRANHFDHVHWAMANGGIINEPVLGMGLQSGKSYAFGERGPETVTPGVHLPGGDSALLSEVSALRADVRGLVRQFQLASRTA